MNEKKNYYIELDNKYKCELNKLDKRYNTISALRAVVFIFAVALLIIGFKDDIFVSKFIGILGAVAFFALVAVHSKVSSKQRWMKSVSAVTERYIKRFEEGWREFGDDGHEFLEAGATVPVDIDLLGRSSLYQMINVAHTPEGRRRLANALCATPKLEPVELTGRQEASVELAGKRDFSIRFEALCEQLGLGKRNIDIDRMVSACDDETDMPLWANIIRFIFPITEIILIILCAIGLVNIGVPILGFIVILAFSWLTKTVTDSIIAPFYSAGFAVDGYREMMELVANTEFASDKLNQIKRVYGGSDGVITAVRKLANICQAFNIMYNPLIHQLLSGLILWDYQIAAVTLAWKRRYSDRIAEGFEGIYEMEFLSSLATIARVKEVSIPKVNYDTDRKLMFSADGLYHPLIYSENVVANSAELEAGITIITGSNMSGKTTFLRTIATNLVLAYIGAPVCAGGLEADYMKLFTSMRVTDDVEHGISTFYAEILRIKAMAEYKDKSEAEAPMLCLIDEIFKGTNSADRIVGAREAITRLASDRCMVIVSTHDFELCTIRDKSQAEASNYHFEEYYEGDELKFDYTLKPGRCTTTNARAILKMAGFDII